MPNIQLIKQVGYGATVCGMSIYPTRDYGDEGCILINIICLYGNLKKRKITKLKRSRYHARVKPGNVFTANVQNSMKNVWISVLAYENAVTFNLFLLLFILCYFKLFFKLCSDIWLKVLEQPMMTDSVLIHNLLLKLLLKSIVIVLRCISPSCFPFLSGL